MEWINLEKALDAYGEKLVEAYKEELASGGINASNDLSNSVKFQVEKSGTVYEVSLSLLDYWKYVEHGRRAGGKFPPISAIEKWIKVKPVIPRPFNGRVPTEKQLAFLIARKIAVEGIEPKPVLKQSVEETTKSMIDEITNAFMEDCGRSIDEVLVLFKNI